MAFRTIVPMAIVTAEVRRDIVALWGGPASTSCTIRSGTGTLFNIVAVFRRSAQSERGDVAAYRAELEHAYRNAHPTMKALLAMLDLGRRQASANRDPIRHWHKGRVALLGDAAHPTLQSLAARCLHGDRGRTLARRLHRRRRWRLRRRLPALRRRARRTDGRVTLESRYIWEVYHSDGIARQVYWQMLSERSEADGLQCLAWLYDGSARA
jgi:salicylate hydroxylase